MWLIKLFAGLFTGGLSGVIGAVGAIIGKLSDNQTAQITAAIGADSAATVAGIKAWAQAYHDRAAMLAGMRVTQALILAALAPALYHQALVFLDSCPFFGIPFFVHVQGSWRVAALPGPYGDREWSLIASLLGIQTGLVGLGSYMRYLHK